MQSMRTFFVLFFVYLILDPVSFAAALQSQRVLSPEELSFGSPDDVFASKTEGSLGKVSLVELQNQIDAASKEPVIITLVVAMLAYKLHKVYQSWNEAKKQLHKLKQKTALQVQDQRCHNLFSLLRLISLVEKQNSLRRNIVDQSSTEECVKRLSTECKQRSGAFPDPLAFSSGSTIIENIEHSIADTLKAGEDYLFNRKSTAFEKSTEFPSSVLDNLCSIDISSDAMHKYCSDVNTAMADEAKKIEEMIQNTRTKVISECGTVQPLKGNLENADYVAIARGNAISDLMNQEYADHFRSVLNDPSFGEDKHFNPFGEQELEFSSLATISIAASIFSVAELADRIEINIQQPSTQGGDSGTVSVDNTKVGSIDNVITNPNAGVIFIFVWFGIAHILTILIQGIMNKLTLPAFKLQAETYLTDAIDLICVNHRDNLEVVNSLLVVQRSLRSTIDRFPALFRAAEMTAELLKETRSIYREYAGDSTFIQTAMSFYCSKSSSSACKVALPVALSLMDPDFPQTVRQQVLDPSSNVVSVEVYAEGLDELIRTKVNKYVDIKIENMKDIGCDGLKFVMQAQLDREDAFVNDVYKKVLEEAESSETLQHSNAPMESSVTSDSFEGATVENVLFCAAQTQKQLCGDSVESAASANLSSIYHNAFVNYKEFYPFQSSLALMVQDGIAETIASKRDKRIARVVSLVERDGVHDQIVKGAKNFITQKLISDASGVSTQFASFFYVSVVPFAAGCEQWLSAGTAQSKKYPVTRLIAQSHEELAFGDLGWVLSIYYGTHAKKPVIVNVPGTKPPKEKTDHPFPTIQCKENWKEIILGSTGPFDALNQLYGIAGGEEVQKYVPVIKAQRQLISRRLRRLHVCEKAGLQGSQLTDCSSHASSLAGMEDGDYCIFKGKHENYLRISQFSATIQCAKEVSDAEPSAMLELSPDEISRAEGPPFWTNKRTEYCNGFANPESGAAGQDKASLCENAVSATGKNPEHSAFCVYFWFSYFKSSTRLYALTHSPAEKAEELSRTCSQMLNQDEATSNVKSSDADSKKATEMHVLVQKRLLFCKKMFTADQPKDRELCTFYSSSPALTENNAFCERVAALEDDHNRIKDYCLQEMGKGIVPSGKGMDPNQVKSPDGLIKDQ